MDASSAAAIASSAASTAGGIFGQVSARRRQRRAEKFNSAEASKARKFQENMSNTAYQRASADMEAAGLNKIMMYGSGGPASSPGAPSASLGQPPTPPMDIGKEVGNIASTALNYRVQKALAKKEIAEAKAKIPQIKQTTQNLNKQNKLLDFETYLKQQQAKKVTKETDAIDSKINLNNADAAAKIASKNYTKEQHIGQMHKNERTKIDNRLAQLNVNKKNRDAIIEKIDMLRRKRGATLDQKWQYLNYALKQLGVAVGAVKNIPGIF